MNVARICICAAVMTATCMASAAHAGGQVTAAHVLRVQISKPLGQFAFIQTDATVATPAACSTNGYWQFTVTLTSPGDSQIYAALLAAAVSGAPVVIAGTNACSEFNTVESLAMFELD